MKYVNYLKLLVLCLSLNQTLIAQVVHFKDYVVESDGDHKFTKAIQAAVIKASTYADGQVFIGAYKGQYTLPVTPIKFYDFDIDNICYNLTNRFDLDCNHMLPGSDGLVDLKNLTITIDCGISLEAMTCYFKGFDEILGFNGFKNFTIKGYGATFTMEGFDWYHKLSEVNHDNANSYQTQLTACGDRLPDFCTSNGSPWQNTRNCRKESTACLECWTGNHHPSTFPQENFAQGRHGIHLANCHNVDIAGIAFDQIYSDGVHIGAGLDRFYQWKHALPSRNITVKDCSFTSCGRVGVCICSTNGTLVTNCAFENNGYVIAGVDIDIEPFNEQHRSLNIVIQNSSFKGAANTAISVGPGGLTQKDMNDRVIQPSYKKIEVTIQDCVIEETEFGLHHAGGPYLPHPNDKVQLNNITLKKLGHEYDACMNLAANKIQACKDSLDNFARIGLLFDSRLTPQLVGNWSLWTVNNLVMKEVSTDVNGHQFTWHSMPVFIRTTHFLDYFLNNRLGCAEDLTECPNYAAGGFVFDELFGGLSLNNVILYDNHGTTSPNVRAAKPIARQEFCIVKSHRFDNTYFLPRFANVKSQNVIKVNPQNVEGYNNVFNANSFECDLVPTTYNDNFQLKTSVVKPSISLSSSQSTVYEGGVANFTFSLSQAVNYPVSIDYQVKGHAANRLDYSYLTSNLIIAANTAQVNLAVDIIKDCVSELNGNENLEIVLLTDKDETYTIQQQTASTKILDLDCTEHTFVSNCSNEVTEEEEQEETNEEENIDEPIGTGTNNNTSDVLGVASSFGVKGGAQNTNTTNEEEEETDNTNEGNVGCKDEVIFNQYPWINQLLNKSNCDDETVTTYSNGNYTFIFVENAESQRLFYQDGTYFCSEQAGFACLQYYKIHYNLTEKNCWSCNSDNAPQPAVPEIFGRYPLLPKLIDLSNCQGTIVQTFEYSHYTYIAITNQSGTHLYLDFFGETPYCSNSTKYYCTDIYNLGNPTETWQCNGTFAKLNSTDALIGLNQHLDKHHIFPNPSNGIFNIAFPHINELPKSIQVYAANSQLIESYQVIEQLIKIDISSFGNGLYFIEIQYPDHSVSEKIIVNR